MNSHASGRGRLVGFLLLLALGASGVAQDQSAPVRVGSTLVAPVRTRYVPPVFPPGAGDHPGGTVVLEIDVAADGKVAGARVLRSIPVLDAAALEAVRQWEFEPTRHDGVAVPVVMTVAVSFVPSNPSGLQEKAVEVAPVAPAHDCSDGTDTPERNARIEAAMRFGDEVNQKQRTAVIARQADGYLPLEQVPGVPTPPAGFDVQFLVDGWRYSLALRDTRDACSFSVFSDQTGRLHLGLPVSAPNQRPF